MKKVTNESLGAVHTHTHTHTGSLKENKKENVKGITLVALVVTIVILLILAGISISALTQTGLFGKAKQAEQKSKDAQEIENTTLAEYENKIDGVARNRESSVGYSLTKIGETTGSNKIELTNCEQYDEIFVRIMVVSYSTNYYTYMLPISLLDDERKSYQIMSNYAGNGFYGGITVSKKDINMYSIRRDNVDYTDKSKLEIYGKKY